jgi:predicted TIM-barrel fold metal-dependent hydrolase
MGDDNYSRRRFLYASGILTAGVALGGKGIAGGTSGGYSVIDIHQHLHYVGRSGQALLDHQKKMGANVTVLLPAGSLAYTASTHYGKTNGLLAGAWGNQACYEFAQKHKNYFFGANEVPDLPHAAQTIEKYLKMGAVMIGEVKFGIDCDAPEMQAIYELAGEYKVPVLMHWQYKMFNYGFERFYKMLEKYPRVNFIGHSQTFWANISGNYTDWSNLYPKGPVAPGGMTVAYLEKYPNLYGDLSAGSGYFALHRDEDFAKDFLNKFSDKLLFGSDCHDSLGEGATCFGSQTIGLVRRVVSDEGVKKKILYANAKKLLKLPV